MKPSGLRAFVLALLWAFAMSAFGQARQEREGVVLYWGVVPAAVVSQEHALADLHGGPPAGGGQIHHLVVALFDAKTGRRIEDAVLRAQLSEVGVVDAPVKYLPPMKINEQMSYGQLFGTVKDGPYDFRVFVKLPDRKQEITFSFSAPVSHPVKR